MKYIRLTKEQLEDLHKEFAEFLANQKIDVKEWAAIKKSKQKMAEEELDIFSDLVWEDVLTKTRYLEHFSKTQIDLFKCSPTSIHRLVIKISISNFDFFDDKDYKWFLEHPSHKKITYLQAAKKYKIERNLELFDLIQKGSTISKGELYKTILIHVK